MGKMIFKFLWNGPDKVTRPCVINSLTNGGLNLTDIETHIKASRLSWIPRVLDERAGPWESYFLFHLQNYGGNLLLKCNYDVNDVRRLTNLYMQLLTWWADFRNSFSDSNYTPVMLFGTTKT